MQEAAASPGPRAEPLPRVPGPAQPHRSCSLQPPLWFLCRPKHKGWSLKLCEGWSEDRSLINIGSSAWGTVWVGVGVLDLPRSPSLSEPWFPHWREQGWITSASSGQSFPPPRCCQPQPSPCTPIHRSGIFPPRASRVCPPQPGQQDFYQEGLGRALTF